MKAVKVVIIMTCLILSTACQGGKKPAVPDGLIGVWKTTTPPYDDRFLEIKTNEIIFGTGEDQFDTYPVTKIKIEKASQETFYTICYKNAEGQEYHFSFYYDPANHGTLRIKNQKAMVWTKEEPNAEKANDRNS
jgi:hypothetical protein